MSYRIFILFHLKQVKTILLNNEMEGYDGKIELFSYHQIKVNTFMPFGKFCHVSFLSSHCELNSQLNSQLYMPFPEQVIVKSNQK